jgi:hypothetical protein
MAAVPPNEETKQMGPVVALDAIWSKTVTFTITWWIYWCVFEISDKAIAKEIIREHNDSAPLLALLGIFPTLISFALLASRVRKTENKNRLGRVPSLWLDVKLNSSVGRAWKWFTIAVGIVLPIAFEGYFWVRFHMRQAWPNTESAMKLPRPWGLGCWPSTSGSGSGVPRSWGLWCYAAPSHLFVHSNDFRYGYIDRWNVASSSVSFIPFWEPLIGAVFSLLTILIACLIVRWLVAPPKVVPSAKRRALQRR